MLSASLRNVWHTNKHIRSLNDCNRWLKDVWCFKVAHLLSSLLLFLIFIRTILLIWRILLIFKDDVNKLRGLKTGTYYIMDDLPWPVFWDSKDWLTSTGELWPLQVLSVINFDCVIKIYQGVHSASENNLHEIHRNFIDTFPYITTHWLWCPFSPQAMKPGGWPNTVVSRGQARPITSQHQ